MIKKMLLAASLCFMLNNINAQKVSVDLNKDSKSDNISPAVKEKIENYSLKINEIVVKEKGLMTEEIAIINKKLSNNEISEAIAKEEKMIISKQYSEKINSEIAALNFDLDDVTKKQVQFSLLNSDSVVPITSVKEKKYYNSIREVHGMLGYGVISLPNGNNQAFNKHNGYNSSIDFGLIFNNQFNRTSPFKFVSGMYLSYKTLRFDDNYFMYRNESGIVDLVQHDKNLDKTKLRAGYLVIPVGLSYNTSKLSTDGLGNYRNINKGIDFGVNFYGGIRISHNNIVSGDGINFRDSNMELGQNKFIYGLQANVAYRGFSIYVRQELSSFFTVNNMDNSKMLQFGLMLGW
jgi:hypothetical protein